MLCGEQPAELEFSVRALSIMKDKKYQEKEKQTKNSGLTRRQLVIGGLALGVAWGVLELFGRGPVRLLLPDKNEKESLPNEWSNLYKHFSKEDALLFEQFLRLPRERQAAIMDTIERRVHDETGFGRLYDHIISAVQPRIISLDALLELGKTNPHARKFHEDFKKGLGVRSDVFQSCYNRQLDLIVEPPRNYPVELAGTLLYRMTRRGVIAHEALHHVQHHSSPLLELYQFLYPHKVTPEGKVTLDAASLQEFSCRFLKKQAAGEAEVFAYIDHVMAEDSASRGLIRELGAQCLMPKIEGNELKLAHEPMAKQNFNPSYLNASMGVLAVVYGYYREQGHSLDIDVRVAEFVGQHGDNLRQFSTAMEQIVGASKNKKEFYGQKGTAFFQERSQQLDKAPAIASGVLKAKVV